jgi:hypothetical protein
VSTVTEELEPATSDPEQQLAWERRHRVRAAIAALVAAAGLLVVNVLQAILQRDSPTTSGLEALQRAVQPGDVATLPSQGTPYFEYLDSKSLLVIVLGVAGLIGWIGVAWTVGFLGVATRARVPVFRRFIIYLPIVGGVLLGVGALLLQIGRLQVVNNFLASDRTIGAVDDADSSLIGFAGILIQLGTLAMAVGLILVGLNAMRAGLLNRMLGYLGIASGAMMVLVALPIVQIFWLGSIGFVLLGRWPGGELPAWKTGTAVPWPTPERPPPRQRRGAPSPSPSTGPAAAQPSSARRKRKKRQ